MEGVWVRSLVRELRSHKQCGRAKKISPSPKKKKKEAECHKEGKGFLSALPWEGYSRSGRCRANRSSPGRSQRQRGADMEGVGGCEGSASPTASSAPPRHLGLLPGLLRPQHMDVKALPLPQPPGRLPRHLGLLPGLLRPQHTPLSPGESPIRERTSSPRTRA